VTVEDHRRPPLRAPVQGGQQDVFPSERLVE